MRNETMEIGETIRRRRELLGLRQPQLASISRISTRSLQLVEMGKANPSLDTLLKIAGPLGLTLKLLLKETGLSNQQPS
jgi:transcriptional regulator with XRE-family HTH domain